VLGGPEAEDARVLAAAREAIAGLRALGDAGLPLDRRRVHDVLAAAPVRLGEDPAPHRVRVDSPEAIRARRFAAVFVCGLQEGEFPRVGTPEPFLSDDLRREVARAGGLALPLREDELDRERYLFYVCASRAERVLGLSTRVTDEEGGPEARSFLLDDVRELFDAEALEAGAARRSLADVTWPAREAPTVTERARALAARGPRRSEAPPEGLSSPEVLAHLEARREFSARAIEAFAGCGVRWLVDELLDPSSLEPDPEAVVRGRYAHAVLRLTYERLAERTGERRVTPGNLATAEGILATALREKRSEFRLSPKGPRVRAAARKLEFDLLRHLRREAGSRTRFEPAELELGFGVAREGELGLPALELAPGGVRVRGRIDRVDVDDGRAVVRDYKSGATVHGVGEWEEAGSLQAALYMLAVREVLGLEPVAGLYVPLSGRRPVPRGVVSAPWADALGEELDERDVRAPEEVEALLDRARERVIEGVGRLRSGAVRPCPETCAWNGRCSHPAICRVERR
nr:PD-(D/E)XK nuclease family protein [Actinomycetota bacterium]